MSNRQDITPDDHWFVGEDKIFPFTIYQADGTTRQDITGWALQYTVRDGATHPSPVITKATGGLGITITDADEGEGEVLILAANSSRLSPGKYWHRIKRTDSGSEQNEVHGDAWLLAGGN